MGGKSVNCFLLSIAAAVLFCTSASAELSKGQTVYVPTYSHIYIGNRETPYYLTATLSIRNTDPANPITVFVIDYYNSKGALLKHYLEKPVELKPIESIRYVVKQKDKAGGSGANFYVTWESDTAVNTPIIESIMIGTENQQGISFTSRGQVIEGGYR